jgi:acyl-CoA synthetase (AMP-forming)/AMP-acid ligase II
VTRFASLADLLQDRAAEQPDERAYVLLARDESDTRTLTWATLEARARVLADQLAGRVAPGDRVLLLFPSCLEFVVAYFACVIAGAIAVPIMPPRRNAVHDASGAIICDCAPRLVLALPDVAVGHGSVTELVGCRGLSCLPVVFEELDGIRPYRSHRSPCRDDIAFLQYTSGSTSAPRGVMVSHGNLLDNLEMMRIAISNHRGSTHVSWLPLYHDMGLIQAVLQSLYLGALCVLMPPVRFMHRPLEWLRAIHRYRGEVTAAPNFAFDHCVDRFRPDVMQGIDLSSWKVAINGAEPIKAETMRRFAQTFAPYGFDAKALNPAYGLAEATVFVSAGYRGRGVISSEVSQRALVANRLAAPDDSQDRKTLIGCGRPAVGITVAIVHPATRIRLAHGAVGEVWIQGPTVAQGYWGRPEESAAVFYAKIQGEAGDWLRTGDLGCFDSDGELHIVGRIKDIIIIRGINHYPQDIEGTVASSHPALRRNCTAAFSVADSHGDEQLVAVQEVERHQRETATTAELAAAIRAAVANDHDVTLRTIVLIEPGTIPKTTSGKIQRTLTRQLWIEGKLTPWAQTQQPAGEILPQS